MWSWPPGRCLGWGQLGQVQVGFEVWKTDGTTAGPHLVRDLNPGTGDAFAVGWPNSRVHNGALFFSAADGVSGIELWMLSQQACP